MGKITTKNLQFIHRNAHLRYLKFMKQMIPNKNRRNVSEITQRMGPIASVLQDD